MGAWSHTIMGNDTANDFGDKILDYMFEQAEYDEEKLLILKFIDDGFCDDVITTKQFNILNKAIEDELSLLQDWKEDCREPRKQLLIECREKLNKFTIDDKN